MNTTQGFSLTVQEMGAHEATLSYTGQMCQNGALALEQHLDRLFGYFKYDHVTLCIESPGGAIDGLDYVLRVLAKWSKSGQTVAVKSAFQCASAAAFLLAMGKWGGRQVDRGTFLLFHNARVDGTALAGMTASLSTSLSQSLSNLDGRLMETLIGKMLREAGGEDGLSQLVRSRLHEVDQGWSVLSPQLSTMVCNVDKARKPPWLSAIQKWARPGTSNSKTVREMKKHLVRRFEREQRMDLLEAYVLCLVDSISGVVDISEPEVKAEIERKLASMVNKEAS